jgi:hypothetical protein
MNIMMILAWSLFLLLGAVVAFAIYAVLRGRKEDREYESLRLPSIAGDDASGGLDSLQSLSVNDVVKDDDQPADDVDEIPEPAEPVSALPMPDDYRSAPHDEDSQSLPMPTDDRDELALPLPSSEPEDQSLPLPPDVTGDGQDDGPQFDRQFDPLEGSADDADDPVGKIDSMINDDHETNPFQFNL